MPELPEVETVRRGLEKRVSGQIIKSVEVRHRRATNPRSIRKLNDLTGSKIISINRRGKFLWFELDRDYVLVAHLGMSGQFQIQPSGTKPFKHTRVLFKLEGIDLHFIDQRTFGWISIEEAHNGVPSSAVHIALDPFDENFDLKSTIENYLSRKTEIKRALLNQEIMSGIGNIYADEAAALGKLKERDAFFRQNYLDDLVNWANNSGYYGKYLQQYDVLQFHHY